MSWNIDITASTNIKFDDITDIVNNLPEELQGHFRTSTQSWGWSCATDIYLPEGKKLGLGGAGFSRHISGEMVDHLKSALRKKGYKYVRNSKRRD